MTRTTTAALRIVRARSAEQRVTSASLVACDLGVSSREARDALALLHRAGLVRGRVTYPQTVVYVATGSETSR